MAGGNHDGMRGQQDRQNVETNEQEGEGMRRDSEMRCEEQMGVG